MALKLNSSGGGSVTLDAVSTATNATITIPATSGGSVVVADSSGNVQAVSYNSGQLAGMRNRIINGDMRIDQRNSGASVSTTVLSTLTYTVDRWGYYATVASKFTVQQNAGAVTPPAGFTKYLGVVSSSAYTVLAADVFAIEQRIEAYNTDDLNWGTANAKAVTLSFWAYSSLTGTFGGVVNSAAGAYSYPFTYSLPSASTWTKISISIPGPTTGTWGTGTAAGIQVVFGLGVGATNSGTAGAWTAASISGVTGAVSVVGTSGATFYVTGVQFEASPVATPYEVIPYGLQLALCQRYYEISSVYNLFSGNTTIASTYYSPVRFSVLKRAAPGSISFTDVVNSGFAAGVPTGANIGADGFYAQKIANATVSGGIFQYSWIASVEL